MIKNSDIARQLMNRYGLQKKASSAFVTTMIDVLNEGLREDRMVKIKGFGTFKMTTISARESVDVNTGERILLNGREKISFTPDAVIRDLVNKPFSHFETVILNDGIDFSDIDEKYKETLVEESVEDSSSQTREQFIEQPAEEPIKLVVEQPAEAVKELSEQPLEEIQEQPIVKNSEQPIEKPAERSDEEMMDNINAPKSVNKYEILFYVTLFALLLTLFVGGGLGYYAFKRYQNLDAKLEQYMASAKSVKEPVAEPANVEKKTEPVGVAEEPVQQAKEEKNKEKVLENVKPAEPAVPDQTLYYKDSRVRTGAYYIMGIAQTVTAQKGQTLAGISRAYLGVGMDCYLEAVNPGVKELKEGQKIHIPALKSKKVFKRK